MAFNRSKAQELALKYLQQGKLAQAIAEYQQILRHDPKDQATLMTVGDLFVRQGNTRQAIECFERLAELFQHEGFNSKAIAIYKKIAKLAPSETGPLERLGELYVQQGVLSEARPLFLQLAETHLKAGRKQQAIEALRKLLEVEPDNLRVQTRLAELYLAIGQKKEAAHTHLNFARRKMEHGEPAEAQKLVDQALEADPGFAPAMLLKAQTLAASGKFEPAIELLEKLPDVATGGEATSLLIDLSLKAGKTSRATELARAAFASGKEQHMLVHRVALGLLEAGEADVALELLGEIRETMIEAGEYEPLSQALLSAAERLPGRLEPLEWLVDMFRKTSDSFRLPDAVARLADATAAAGQFERANSLYEELLERDPDNESLLQLRNQVREKLGLERIPLPEASGAPAAASTAPAQTAILPEPPLDEETQRYVSQALTDVDLFSSYGLTQKAIQLLENVRQRAPRHSPTLERLLDLYVGAGDDRPTAELAAELEQIHRGRGDVAAAERFAQLRRRFQRAAGLSDEELTAAQPAQAPPELPVGADAAPAVPPVAPETELPAAAPPPVTAEAPMQELDLSDEWAALAAEVAEGPATVEPPAAEQAPPPTAPEPASEEAKEEVPEFELELVPKTPAAEEEKQTAMSQEDFLNSLAAEVEELEPLPEAAEPEPATAQASTTPPVEPGSVEQLQGVFQDFRSELEELGEEEEDIETHYNLGIAYREMGLLDEAIGEFQKVAKAVQAGQPFRYAMQCSTLLGLTFMSKGEPKIAALWYERALEIPNLDQESVMALRYDLGVAQEQAGEKEAALESFRQVYAMNIDYRDVVERIAALQKN